MVILRGKYRRRARHPHRPWHDLDPLAGWRPRVPAAAPHPAQEHAREIRSVPGRRARGWGCVGPV